MVQCTNDQVMTLGFLDKFKKKGTAPETGPNKKAKAKDRTGPKGRKVFVLSIDGTPFTFLQKAFKEGTMPNLAELADRGSFRQMESVLPVVSSVQWATFQAGRNPAKHGIFGFVDRVPGSYQIFLPNGKDLEGKIVQEVLSDQGRRVFSMNVPESYPPRKVNGIMIGGFLCPSVNKAAHPLDVCDVLSDLEYVIDAEPWVAHEDLDKFIGLVFKALESRKRATLHFYKEKRYDLFMVHVMETDRINHFAWRMYEKAEGDLHDRFVNFYKEIDGLVGDVMKALRKDTELVIMSDHGFCELEQEVNTNRWLADNGFLTFANEKKEMSLDLEPSKTQVYSMIPGRFFVNLKGREPGGVIKDGEEKEKLIEGLMEALRKFKDEEGRQVMEKVVRREEVYDGPLIERAADVIAHPVDGFDLKAGGEKVPLYRSGALNGMHTFHDATFITSDVKIDDRPFSILDTPRTLLKVMRAEVPSDWDGKDLF